MLLHNSYVIPSGEQAELTLFGKATGLYLEDGWVFIPNVLHFTVSLFEFAFLCGLRYDHVSSAAMHGRIDISHRYDQGNNNWNVNTDVGPFAAFLMKSFEKVGIWLFQKTHLIPMRLGFIGLIACVVISSVITTGHKAYSTGSSVITSVGETITSGAQTLGIIPQSSASKEIVVLDRGQRPADVPWEFFNPTRDPTLRETMPSPGDGRIYYLYNEPTPTSIDLLKIDRAACVVVPAGRKIRLLSDRKPIYADNVEDRVTIVHKKYGFTLGSMFDNVLIEVTDWQWEKVHDHWEDVETKRHIILVKALESWELPKGSSGARICF